MGMIANTQLKAARGPLLLDWRPEDPEFWARNGKRIASRNLWISIPALLLAFAVWMIWSTVTVRLNSAGFAFSNDQLFLLAALPSISGATLRVFYSFMVPIFGGRRWTALSTASMLIPCIWLGFAVQDPSTPYWVFALIALLCGFGGGNFASSMSNISFFYPKSQQGTALGLNAGLGNLGVSVMQFAVPLAVAGGLFGAFGGEPQQLGDGGRLWLQNAGWIWVPFIAVVSVAAWFGMNDIADAKASFRDQAVIFKRKHNWLMCWLYVATFGSFIGFLGRLRDAQQDPVPRHQPAAIRLPRSAGGRPQPAPGRLAGGQVRRRADHPVELRTDDRRGVHGDRLPAGRRRPGQLLRLPWRLHPAVLLRRHRQRFHLPHDPGDLPQRVARRVRDGQADEAGAARNASMESAAVIGFSAAIGAFGGFFIPKAFGTSLHMTGSAEGALYVFIAYYLSCIVATWWWYARKGAESPC